jgi:DNA-binding IclR family transcriptional regulator
MPDGIAVRFIARRGSDRGAVASRLGRTTSAQGTSTAKAMPAQLPQPELHQLPPDEALERITERSIGTGSTPEAELARIREQGYAVNRKESGEGVASVLIRAANEIGDQLG